MAVVPHLPREFGFEDEEGNNYDLSSHPDVDILTELIIHANPREVARTFVDVLPNYGVTHVIGRLNRSVGNSTLDKFQEGEVVQGIIVRRYSGHYVVDVYGARGLLAISDACLEPGPVLLEEGDVIHPIVLRVDPKDGVLALGLKQKRKDPWNEIWRDYPFGCHVKARVIPIGEHGIMLKIESGIFGRAELDETREIDQPLQIADVVEVRVVGYHAEDREIIVRLVESCYPMAGPMRLLPACSVNLPS